MRKVLVASVIGVLSIGLIMSTSMCATAQEAKKEVTVGFVTQNLTNAYFVATLEGIKEECKKRGWELKVANCMDDPDTHLRQVEDFIQAGVDLIICFLPSLEEGGVAADEAYKAGIPFIPLDGYAKSDRVSLTMLACDDIPSGRMQAEYVIGKIGTEGTVVILEGLPGDRTAYDRTLGNLQILENYPDIRIIRQPADWSAEKAMNVMENILQAEPNIDAVVTNNDTMVLGALSALEAAHMREGILLVGWDAIPPAIEVIKEGGLDATVRADAVGLGRDSITYGEKILTGERFECFLVPQPWGLANAVIMKTMMVTKDNVNTLYPD